MIAVSFNFILSPGRFGYLAWPLIFTTPWQGSATLTVPCFTAAAEEIGINSVVRIREREVGRERFAERTERYRLRTPRGFTVWIAILLEWKNVALEAGIARLSAYTSQLRQTNELREACARSASNSLIKVVRIKVVAAKSLPPMYVSVLQFL